MSCHFFFYKMTAEKQHEIMEVCVVTFFYYYYFSLDSCLFRCLFSSCLVRYMFLLLLTLLLWFGGTG